ncbi:MAG TPA: beta-eliminating lyase-related protein [Candidatus Saccharimonadia bacterium]|nr:beta-eliminating lyase-related protein [Candidatus Saccharimonadia bacterium]
MHRRHFLAASGLAALTPALANAASPSSSTGNATLLKRVTFQTDGLGLAPREYAALLAEATVAREIKPDYYSNEGFIAELEQQFARLLGKEAAMFIATGTLANLLAVRKLAGSERRVLVQAESHFYNDSGDGAVTLAGLNLVPLAAGRGTLELAEVKAWVERSASGRVPLKVGAISIENPVRRRDHEMVDFDELRRVCAYAREQGIRLHLDGARMFNLPLHSGKSIKEHAALFDTVYVSLWKHFNGASGAMLAGDAAFIEGLYETRRMFGGSLPQAWPLVGLVPGFVETYEADYAKSWRAADELIERLAHDERFEVRRVPNGTSRFLLSLSGVDANAFAERAKSRDVLVPKAMPGTSTMQMQVNPSILRMPVEQIAEAVLGAARTS